MNRCKPAWRIFLLLLAVLLTGAIRSASAQGSESHAGLVLQFADGSTKTYCVAFTEESISGLDLLLKTELEVRVESFGAAGAMICKIGPDGCDFPEEACVCESYGPGGVYWSYHHLQEGSWKTSGVGISQYRLRDGEVDGLAWSAGKPPPVFTFSQICLNVGAQPATQVQPTGTTRPPAPVPTRPLPTFTPEPPRPQPTREPTLLPATPGPSNTPQPRATATSRATNTTQPAVVTTTPTVQSATATGVPTSLPMFTPGAATFTPTPIPLSTDTALPARAAVAPTPTAAVIEVPRETGDGMARNIALGIGLATLAGLVGWGIWRGRRKRGSNVG